MTEVRNVNTKTIRIGFGAVVALLLVWGLIGVGQRLILGHELGNEGSYVPWGLWVSAYIYFVGLSAGAFLLASLVYIFNVKRLTRIARPALLVAAVTLMMALICIWFDLGRMWRFYEIFTRPNFTSLMTWMVWLYTAYFLLVLAELWLELRVDIALLARGSGRLAPLYRLLMLGWQPPEEPEALEEARAKASRAVRVLAAVGLPLAITFHGGVGALFAGLLARPYWHSALYPILFLTGALVSGGGLLLALVAFGETGRGKEGRDTLQLLGRVVLGLLLFDVLLEWTELSIHSWYRIGPEYELLRTVLLGENWYVFWIVHLLLGVIIPLFLLIRRPLTNLTAGVSGALVAVTFMAVRLNIVIPGQITPQLQGLQDAYVDQRLLFSYMPSMYEWSVVAFVVAFGVILFFLGKRYLPITEHPRLAAEVLQEEPNV